MMTNSQQIRDLIMVLNNRIEVFNDTSELVEELQNLAESSEDNHTSYYLRESATSLAGLYNDLKEAANQLSQLVIEE